MQPQYTTPSDRLRYCYRCRRQLAVSSFPTPSSYCCTDCNKPRPKAGTAVDCVCPQCGSAFVHHYRRGNIKQFCSVDCRKKAYAARSRSKVALEGYNIRRAYGISREQARALYDAQGGKCALCVQAIPWAGRERAIDHDHATGKVRGILCRNCNHMLGYLERLSVSRRAWLARAEAYLKEAGS